eukprot:9342785-Pyramimonas_sp.AAC.1
MQAHAQALQAGQAQQHQDHKQLLHAIQEGLIQRDDGKVAQLGTLAAIKKAEELDVFLARGCDTAEVEICKGLLGHDLFHGLRRACEGSKHLMLAVGCPTT